MKKILALAVLIFFSGKSFAAVYSVENISEKVKGDRLSLADVNSILGTIRGFFFDDSTGFVGIGTGDPTVKLEIAGSDWDGIKLTNDGNIGTLKYDPVGTYVEDKQFLILSDETTNADGSNAGIMFRTNNGDAAGNVASRMVIRETGNVGIGTSEPATNLEILDDNPTITLNNISLNQELSGAIIFSEGDELKHFQIQYIGLDEDDASTGDGKLNFIGLQDVGSVELMTIERSGNIGIGTSTPAADLDINDISEGFPAIKSWGKDNNELDFAVPTEQSIHLGTHDGTANGGTTLFIIYPNGNATLSGILTEDSDSRLKKNIQTLSSPLEKITALRGVEFEWKDRENQSTQIGLVAQEVAEVFPELVQVDANGTHSVAYSHLVAPLIEAVKTQQTEIQTLRERVQKLENKEEN